MPAPAEDASRLAETTLALVNIPSESRNEGAAAAWIEDTVPVGRLSLVHAADSTLLYLTERRAGRPLVLLAGHLDTVPAQGNIPGRIEGGAVHGLGASDMKGGVAVLVELARWLEEEAAPLTVDLALLFFPREELPPHESALPALFAAYPPVLEAELGIMLEPTDCAIHAGCLGNLVADLVWHGVSAHSARPWTGTNAIERAVTGLAAVVPWPAREVDLSGLRFVEVASVTGIEGGIAMNVLPDRCVARVNLRYAPDRSAAAAEELVRELAAQVGAEEVALVGNSPAAPVVVETPLVERLRAAGELEVLPKQAWTPVAELAEAGVDAINFGPGATAQAHRREEHVEVAALERVFRVLRDFLRD